VPNIALGIDSASENWGDIDFINGDGEMDATLLGYDFALRDFTLLLVNPCDPRSEANTLLKGKASDAGFKVSGKNAATLTVHDKSKALDTPLTAVTVVYPVGEEDDEEEVVLPVCYGQVFNITPVYIGKDGQNYPLYRFNDGASQALIELRDRGVVLKSGLNYTVNLATSTLTLLVPPDGELTADVRGQTRAGAWLFSAADIVRDIIVNRTELTEDDLDTDSFDSLAEDVPFTLGFYETGGGNVKSTIQQVLDSIGGYISPRRNGYLRVGRLGDTSAPAAALIYRSDLRPDGFTQKDTGRPIKSILLGYKRNYSNQSRDSLGDSIFSDTTGLLSEEDRNKFSLDWLKVKAQNTNAYFLAKYKGAEDLAVDETKKEKITETLLQIRAETQQEAQRRIALYSLPYRDFDLAGYAKFYDLDVGDVVTIYHTRHGFENGKTCQVHKIDIDVLNRTGTITVRCYV